MAKKKGGGKKASKKGDATATTASSSSRGDGGGPSSSTFSRAEKNNAAANRGNPKRGGKLKTSSDDDDAQFRNLLLNQGHLIREMNSDGNCLFRSLSDQLYNDDGDDHGTVRKEICDHLEQHKDEFQSFLLMNEDDEDVMNIDDYVEHMREHTTWGSDIEIVAASRKYNVGIKVFSTHYGVLRFGNHEEQGNKSDDSDSDLLLSYHGNDHYNSVHPMDGSNNRQKRRNPSRTGNSLKSSHTSAKLPEEKEDENSKTQSTIIATTDNTKKRRAAPPKGSACPCGSGLKYKKCCLGREKAKKRLAKMNNTVGNGDDDDNDDNSEGDQKKEEVFIGEFKVLNI